MTVGYYILIFLFGLVLLVWGSSLFVDSAVSVAGRLHLPEVLIGATIVSLGTTLPEVLFSTMASVRHLPEMAIGNALGSILCNTGFIAGMMLVLRPIYLSGKAVANVVSGTVFLGLSFAVYVAGGVMGQGLSRTTGGMLLVICIQMCIRDSIQSTGSISCRWQTLSAWQTEMWFRPRTGKLCAAIWQRVSWRST